MTENDKKRNETVVYSERKAENQTENGIPVYNSCFLPNNSKVMHYSSLNLSEGTSGTFIHHTIQNADLIGARERIKINLEKGKSYKESFKEAARKSAGHHFKCGGSRLGKDTWDIVKENIEKKRTR